MRSRDPSGAAPTRCVNGLFTFSDAPGPTLPRRSERPYGKERTQGAKGISGKRFNRRSFLGGAAAGLGTYAILGGPAILTSRGQVGTSGSFTQSVASGDPATNGITLWTRVEDIGGNGRVDFEIARDQDFEGAIRGSAQVGDNGIVKTPVGDLAPGEEYFYRFFVGGNDGNSPVGRFRTLRPAGSQDAVKIAFFSCQEFGAGFYYPHRDLATFNGTFDGTNMPLEEDEFPDIDLVVCLGDYIYERVFDSQPVREDESGRNNDGEVETLSDYREKYNLHHTDQRLLEVRRKFPMMVIWDDHEVEDNHASMRPGGATESRELTYDIRQANGYRAFFEYQPRFASQNSGRGDRINSRSPVGRPENGIYTSIDLGNAEVFLLDTRQFRDDQVCDPRDDAFRPNCPPSEYNKPGRTLLGDEQKRWLKGALRRSKAKWKVIATQIMIMSLDAAPRVPLNVDQWDGYGDERRELLDFIGGRTDIDDRPRGGAKIDNVAFITGDIHTFFAGSVTRSGRTATGGPGDLASGQETFVIAGDQPDATEFVGGSITTKGIVDRVGREEFTNFAAAQTADRQVRLNNPHLAYVSQAYKGYGVLRAGDDLDVEYRAACDVTSQADDGTFSLATFLVEDGSNTVVQRTSTFPGAPSDGASGPPPPGICKPGG